MLAYAVFAVAAESTHRHHLITRSWTTNKLRPITLTLLLRDRCFRWRARDPSLQQQKELSPS